MVSEVTKYILFRSGRFCSFLSSFFVAAKKPNTAAQCVAISDPRRRGRQESIRSSLDMQTSTSMLNERIAQAFATRPICRFHLSAGDSSIPQYIGLTFSYQSRRSLRSEKTLARGIMNPYATTAHPSPSDARMATTAGMRSHHFRPANCERGMGMSTEAQKRRI